MRVVPFRDLPVGWEAAHVLLMHHAFGSSWDPRELSTRRFESQYPRYADYVGLCAVEGSRIASSIVVRRFPFRTRKGDVTCSGLGHVATLPSHSRQGLARKLIERAHDRERHSGSPFMLLYTGRSIVAHSLYESLGYRDVLEFPKATRLVPPGKRVLPRGWRWRRARREDRHPIKELRADLSQGRCGFSRQGVDWWPGPRGWFVLERDDSIVGYASVKAEGKLRACHEGMARTATARALLLRSLETEASGGWLLLGSPLLHELRRTTGIRAYRRERGSYSVLMAKSLNGLHRPRDLAHELGTDRPGFLIGIADSF